MGFSARLDKAALDARKGPRRTLYLGATGRTGDGDTPVTVHNISATGLLLESRAPLTVGETIEVDLPENDAARAKVVWASEPMFGCQFETPLTPAALSAAQLRSTPSVPGGEEALGDTLHRLRLARGLSLGDVAARLGVSKPTVWAWEHGRSRPVEHRLTALGEVLGLGREALDPQAPALPDILAQSRERIAAAYGVSPASVRIMIEL